MRSLGCHAALYLLLLAPWQLLAATQCGAFSHDGSFANAVIGQDLQLTVTSPSNSEKSYTLSSKEARICRISFSEDDQFVAVSLVSPKPSTSVVSVALLNRKSGSWVGNKPVQPSYSQFPGGFVGSTHTVATAFLSGIWELGSSLRFQVFTINAENGQLGKSILRPLNGPPTSLFPTSFDTTHNRLWNRLPDTACGLHGISVLDANWAFDIPTNLLPGCTNPTAIEFPSVNDVVIASQNQESIRVWHFDLAAKKADTLDLPADGTRAVQLMEPSAHSTDGAVVAFAVKVLTKDRFGGLHPGSYSVALVSAGSSSPIKLYDLNLAAVSQLAVHHHDGRVTIEANDGNHWVRFSDVR